MLDLRNLWEVISAAITVGGVIIIICIVIGITGTVVIFFSKVWEHINLPHTSQIDKWVDSEFNNCTFEKDGMMIKKGSNAKFSMGENLTDKK